MRGSSSALHRNTVCCGSCTLELAEDVKNLSHAAAARNNKAPGSKKRNRPKPRHPQPPDSLTTELKPINQSPSPSNYRSQQLPTRCHQPGDTNSNAPRPPSSLTTEHESNTRAQSQQSRTATANTMPSTRRHYLECTSAAKQLDDRVEPKAEPTTSNHNSNCQHDATNQTTPFQCTSTAKQLDDRVEPTARAQS